MKKIILKELVKLTVSVLDEIYDVPLELLLYRMRRGGSV